MATYFKYFFHFKQKKYFLLNTGDLDKLQVSQSKLNQKYKIDFFLQRQVNKKKIISSFFNIKARDEEKMFNIKDDQVQFEKNRKMSLAFKEKSASLFIINIPQSKETQSSSMNNTNMNQNYYEIDESCIYFFGNQQACKFEKQQQFSGFEQMTSKDRIPDQFRLCPISVENDLLATCYFCEDEKMEDQEDDFNQQEKYLLTNTPDKQVDQKSCRIIQRRIDKEIRFDLFYYCLLEECKNKRQIEKKRKQKTKEKHHRSLISLFVLFKLVLLEKKGEINLEALRERVEQRIMKKYQKIAGPYGHLLKSQLDIIFKSMSIFSQKRQSQAIQAMYLSRQSNKSSINKMEKCQSIVRSIRASRK